MLNVNVDQYISYFRNLAVTHHLIQHDPDTENGGGNIEHKRFARWGVEEAVAGLRSALGDPALLLEMYEVVTASSNVYDIKPVHSGAFTVVKSAATGNTQEEVEAFTLTESIVTDLLRRIWQDHYGKNKNRCNTPFADVVFNGLNIVPVGPLFTNHFGWRVEFQFKPKNLFDVTAPLDDNTFIQSIS